MNTASYLIVPSFDGDRTVFPSWLDSLRENAIAFEELTGCVSSWLFTPDEWRMLPFAGYTPAQVAIPAHDGIAAVAAQAERFAPAYDTIPMPAVNNQAHTIQSSNYQKQQQKRAEFRTTLTNALSVKVKNNLTTNGTKLFNLSPHQIISALREEYGQLRSIDIENLRAKLRHQFNNDEKISDFIHTQVNIHRILSDAGQVLSDNLKIEYLKNALLPCGHYDLAIQIFESSNPNVAITTFNMFSTHLKNFRTTPSTAVALGYAAATTKPTYEALEAQVKALKANPRSTTRNKKNFYCWTHGSCPHRSSECKDPAPGHVAHAKYWKRFEGSNEGCYDNKK